MCMCCVHSNVHTRDIDLKQQAISRNQRTLLLMKITEFIPTLTLTVLSIAPDFVSPHQVEISEAAVNIKENFQCP